MVINLDYVSISLDHKLIEISFGSDIFFCCSFQLDSPGRSCEFHGTNANLLLCSTDKNVLLFDKRMNSKFMAKLDLPHDKPVMSLSYVTSDYNNFGANGFFSTSLGSKGGLLWWEQSEQNLFKSHEIETEGIRTQDLLKRSGI